MALIPVLAMIIFVGVFAAFAIAVAALILYYLRSGKARAQAAESARSSPPAEEQLVMTPSPAMEAIPGQPVPAIVYTPPAAVHVSPAGIYEPTVTPSVQHDESIREDIVLDPTMWMFQEYDGERFVPIDPNARVQDKSRKRQQDELVREDAGLAWA